MKRLLFILTIFIGLVATAFSQKPKVIKSYDEITENDSIVDFKHLGFGCVYCHKCILFTVVVNKSANVFNAITKEVNQDNLPEMVEAFNLYADCVLFVGEAWENHWKSDCKAKYKPNDLTTNIGVATDVSEKCYQSVEKCMTKLKPLLQQHKQMQLHKYHLL